MGKAFGHCGQLFLGLHCSVAKLGMEYITTNASERYHSGHGIVDIKEKVWPSKISIVWVLAPCAGAKRA
jgi:hypothetical protein